jgi:Zn-dependent protease with chaperone function
VAYLGLIGWLLWTSYRLFSAASADTANVFVAIGTTFLGLFLIKALFFLERGEIGDDIEVTKQNQPCLFEFLNRLADELGASRPYRVYLSPRVNACVFYDLSPLNLIIPSRKNLEIGLGLVNVLNVGELKAVLAHEFGHFAQRTMAVGRWVYISHQIAAHIVAKRDAFDGVLASLSRLDIRIAWIGWLFRLIVWAIRSAVELMFNIVVLAQRAMSREMEFQADLVAVSVTGSDALIHALHKLNAADHAWSHAVSFAVDEAKAGRRTTDLFSLQDRVIDMMRRIFSDPSYGSVPERQAGKSSDHKVFKTSLTSPRQMWATHPSNTDREVNAKRRYIPAEIDPRAAWTIFDNINELKDQISSKVSRNEAAESVSLDESLQRLDAQYAWMYLKPVFRGAYLMRSTVMNAAHVSELYGAEPTDLVAALDALYPASLTEDVKERRAIEEERDSLRALSEGALKRVGPIGTYRGREITPGDVSALIDSADKEFAAVDARLREHDRSCRIAHLVAARRKGERFEAYLRGLLRVHHYASHAEADLQDAKTFFYLKMQLELSRKWPWRANRETIVSAGRVVFDALGRQVCMADFIFRRASADGCRGRIARNES